MTEKPAPLWERLTELSKLEDGWLDGYGTAPSMDALEIAGRIVTALPRGLAPILITPTEAGGVQLEWSDQHGGHEIEIMPDLHLFLLTVEPSEQQAADAYDALLRAPMPERTAAALRARLESGDVPRRKVRSVPSVGHPRAVDLLRPPTTPDGPSKTAGFDDSIDLPDIVPDVRDQELAQLRAEVKAARQYAAEMRDFASPHGVSVHYADSLTEAMDRAKEQG